MGEFSILTVKLLFLFLPGIIYCLLYERWNLCPRKEFNMFIIHSFVWGVASYTLYYGIIKVFKINQELFFINDILNIEEKSIHYNEIIWACFIAFILVYVASHWKNHHISKKIFKKDTYMQKIENISALFKKMVPTYVDNSLGVWDSVFANMYKHNSGWVKVHNISEKIVYYGYVEKYSDTVENNELYLVDVEVQDLKGKKLKNIPGLYISQRKEDIIIEIIDDSKGEENDRQTK